AQPNQQRQPVFKERFHPEIRRLKSEISTETPNIQHRTLNVQYQKEIRHRSSELRIGRWTTDVGRLRDHVAERSHCSPHLPTDFHRANVGRAAPRIRISQKTFAAEAYR